jgi:hypothetical protein
MIELEICEALWGAALVFGLGILIGIYLND